MTQRSINRNIFTFPSHVLDVKSLNLEFVSSSAGSRQEQRRHKALTQAGVLVSGEGSLLSSPQTSASLDTTEATGLEGRQKASTERGGVRGRGVGGGFSGQGWEPRTRLVEQDIEMAANRGS